MPSCAEVAVAVADTAFVLLGVFVWAVSSLGIATAILLWCGCFRWAAKDAPRRGES